SPRPMPRSLCSSRSFDSPLELHSFPTRRSSDLIDGGGGHCRRNCRGAFGRRGRGHSPSSCVPPRVCAKNRANGVPRNADPAHSQDRKSTRLNSSHLGISYAVFCLKKKKSLDATQ